MADYILEMKNITKVFPGVKALDSVNLQVERGEIHALCGENGAGKSTLMNVLSGIYPYGTYTGDIVYNGENCEFKTIKDSEAKGIVIIHQELALVPYLSIAENVFLGNEQTKLKGVIDWNETYSKTFGLLERVGLKDNPATLIKNIGVGKQQLVEIAKALSKNVQLLILDEPTASLNDEDSEHLLELLRGLKKEGITSIIISHKLNELEKISDNITVVRDGKCIETLDNTKGEVSEDRIIKGMVGREITDRFPKREKKNIGDIALEVKNWNVYDPLDDARKIIKDVNLNVRKGEVVGLVGLMGAGRTELAMSVYGHSYGVKISGETYMNGKKVKMDSTNKALMSGLAYATEDRKSAGLILIDDVMHNTTIASLDKISKNKVIDKNMEVKVAEEYRGKLNIKTPSILQKVGNLSGGNQQKVALARWIFRDPDVLILDEPTRGIDVGAKYEIYCIINDLVASGKAVIMISSEMPEVLGMADRVYVVNEGRIVGELDQTEATQESIMKCIMQSNREAN